MKYYTIILSSSENCMKIYRTSIRNIFSKNSLQLKIIGIVVIIEDELLNTATLVILGTSASKVEITLDNQIGKGKLSFILMLMYKSLEVKSPFKVP